MRDHDNLAALIDDAGALADHFCSSLPGGGAQGQLNAASRIVDKAGAYRELLYCRFADQAFSAARSARHGRPASTSSLTLSAFETFTRLHELRDHLDVAFRNNCLDALDNLVTSRLFGDGEALLEDKDGAFSLGLSGEEGGWDGEDDLDDKDAEDIDGERLEDIALSHPIADNDCDDDDHDCHRVDPGACRLDTQAEKALRRLMCTLIAIETSFENCYRALDDPMRRLDEMLGGHSNVRA